MSQHSEADSQERPATGPVAGQDPSSSQAAGEGPNPAPPVDERPRDPSQGPAESAGTGSSEQVESDLDALLEDTKRERDEYLGLAQRTKADFENYRKRMAADVQAAAARGKGELARELIDAVDNLERALASAGVDPERPEPLDGAEGVQVEDPAGLAHGVLLVLRGIQETLRRNGIEPLDPRGEKFDPNWHEALSSQPTDGAESGTVVEVMQKGYKLGDHLIRPARVVVAE